MEFVQIFRQKVLLGKNNFQINWYGLRRIHLY